MPLYLFLCFPTKWAIKVILMLLSNRKLQHRNDQLLSRWGEKEEEEEELGVYSLRGKNDCGLRVLLLVEQF